MLDYAIIHFSLLFTHVIQKKPKVFVFGSEFNIKTNTEGKNEAKYCNFLVGTELRQYREHFMHVNVIDDHHLWSIKPIQESKIKIRQDKKMNWKNSARVSKINYKIMDPVSPIDLVTKQQCTRLISNIVDHLYFYSSFVRLSVSLN